MQAPGEGDAVTIRFAEQEAAEQLASTARSYPERAGPTAVFNSAVIAVQRASNWLTWIAVMLLLFVMHQVCCMYNNKP